jgi:hypothetical protein
MNSVKYLALLIAVLIGLLLFGATSSSATAICELEAPECPAADIYAAKSAVEAQLATETVAAVATSVGTIECKGSTIKGKTLAEEAEPLGVEISGVTNTNCTLSSTGCTVTAKSLPYEASLTYTEEGDGTLTATMQTEIVCEGFISCLYSGAASVPLEGGEPSKITFNTVSLTKVSGFLCPKKAQFSATYVLQQPGGGRVNPAQGVARTTKLCTVAPGTQGNPQKLVCGGAGYAGEIRGELVAGWSGVFYVLSDTTKHITCNEVKWSGKFAENGAPAAVDGGIRDLTLKSNGVATCTSNLAGNPAVTVTMRNLTYDPSAIIYEGVEPPQGRLAIAGRNGNPVEVQLAFNAETCTYERKSFTGLVYNTNPSAVFLYGRWHKQLGGGGCPADLSFETELKFLRPLAGQPDQNVFVANE